MKTLKDTAIVNAVPVVKVYKTDVHDRLTADRIIDEIGRHLPDSDTSFDLEDCDKVLRVEIRDGEINEKTIARIVENFGNRIETLL